MCSKPEANALVSDSAENHIHFFFSKRTVKENSVNSWLHLCALHCTYSSRARVHTNQSEFWWTTKLGNFNENGYIQPHSEPVEALPLHQQQAVALQICQNQMPVGLDIKGRYV